MTLSSFPQHLKHIRVSLGLGLTWASIPIILPLLERIFPQILRGIILHVWRQVGHIECGGCAAAPGQVDFADIVADPLGYLKWSLIPWHEFRLVFRGEMLLSLMYPHWIPGIKDHLSPMFVCLDLVRCIDLLNFALNLLMELLDLLDSLGCVHISSLIHGLWSEVKRGDRVNPIKNRWPS